MKIQRHEVIDEVLSKCRGVLGNPQQYLLDWKSRSDNGKIVAFFPTYIPVEVIQSLNCLPVGIMGGSIGASAANAHIQQFTCSIVRSATEYALKGTFDCVDAVLFPPTCDSVKLVGSMWAKNFKEKFYVDMLNVPEKVDSPRSVEYTQREIERIIRVLSENIDVDFSVSRLEDYIKKNNRIREITQKLSHFRYNNIDYHLSFEELYTLLKAGTFYHCDDYLPLLEAVFEVVEPVVELNKKSSAIPVVLTGLACQLPHPSLFQLINDCGFNVIEDDLLVGIRSVGQVSLKGDLLRNIAEGYVSAPPMATRHNSNVDRAKYLKEQVENSGAKAVIMLSPKFCEPELFDLYYMRNTFREQGIAALALDFEEEKSSDGALETRLEAFAESIY